MASDSEGLRQKLSSPPYLPPFFVANGFRFGRVTTKGLVIKQVGVVGGVANGFRFGRVTTKNLVVSPSREYNVANGFRFGRVTTKSSFPPSLFASSTVANGFRFGRVTTKILYQNNSWPVLGELQMASDSEGLRQLISPIFYKLPESCKWLPIRKGYDYSRLPRLSTTSNLCCKWLPIRKGYDFPTFLTPHPKNSELQMASYLERLRKRHP